MLTYLKDFVTRQPCQHLNILNTITVKNPVSREVFNSGFFQNLVQFSCRVDFGCFNSLHFVYVHDTDDHMGAKCEM